MKKIISIIVLLSLVMYPIKSFATEEQASQILNSQKNSSDITFFIKEAEKYTKNVYEDIDFQNFLTEAITGKIDNEKIGKSLLTILGKETISSIYTIISIIIIIIIHSILKSISEGLENKSISQISYYIQYILIVTLIMKNFGDILTVTKESINSLVAFSNTLIPILITLIITTGNIISANVIQPILLFLITFIGNFIYDVIIPMTLTSTVLGIISKVSERVQLEKLSKFFKSSTIWILGIILTLFVSLISIEGSLSSNVDGITAKTAKAAVSSLVPVVGKILSDSVDTIIGCTSILKNAVGTIGVIVIIGICITPIIKLLLLMITYYIGSAICEPIADKKIVSLLELMGDTFKILMGILCSLAVMIIIGTTLVMKISNSGLMYR